jgi:hypothetical protein
MVYSITVIEAPYTKHPPLVQFPPQAARAGALQLRQDVVEVGGMLDQVMRTTVPMAKRSIVLEKVGVNTRQMG